MKKIIFLMGLFFLGLYIIPLGIRPLAIPDEVRYGEIPREMVDSNDWIVPRLNGLLYFEKPVMGYWLNGLAIKSFGKNAFAVRISSALSAGLSALMVFFLASKFGVNTRKGVLATAIYLSFFIVFGLGVFSLLDGMFSFFLTACIGFFFLAWSNRDKTGLHRLHLVIAGIFCGFAFLTKGFLAFALPISVIVPFLLWERQYKMIFTASWIPILTALIVILPWAVLVHLHAPDYWNFFFWHEHVKRFFSQGAQHKESIFFYCLVLPAAIFPWTFLAPTAIAGLIRKKIQTPDLRYAVCWFVFPFLLFSFSSGKLPTYILPCFPALAILMATGLFESLTPEKNHGFNKGVICLMGFTAVIIIALILLQNGVIKKLPHVYNDTWKAILFMAAMVVFAGVLNLSLRAKDRTKKILLFAAAPLFFYLSAHFLVPDKTLLRKCPGGLIQRNIDKITPKTLVVSPSTPVRAVCWFLERDDVYMLDKGELVYGLGQTDAAHRLLTQDQLVAMAKKNRGKQKMALIMDQRKYEGLKTQLPPPKFLDSSGTGGFVFILF
jgi:4-amino-4-deoxy-L-arabinose transferase